MAPQFEERPHTHARRLTKAELIRHLAVPHRRPGGGWTSLVTQPRGWTMQELERDHERFHGPSDGAD